jgi:integrase
MPARDFGQKKSRLEEQIRRTMISESTDHEWHSMTMFGAYTGQRLMDLATLSWNNIDLDADVVLLETAKTGRTMTIPIAAPERPASGWGVPRSQQSSRKRVRRPLVDL